MGHEEREIQKFVHILLLGGFVGLAVGALAAWVGGGTSAEVLWSSSGGGMLGVFVATCIGMTRRGGVFRD